jgi:2-polyprenyl-3-methyl-5-hydroxy-6-metoxy-1,4-benzoquinol methylase
VDQAVNTPAPVSADTAARDYSDRYDPDLHIDRIYSDETAQAIAEWIRPGDRLLEFGSATGRMSERFARAGAVVTGVERSQTYIARAVARTIPDAVFLCGDIVGFQSSIRFDHVTATNVIHELDDPVGFLRECRSLLAPHGRVHVSLQNPNSIHRQIGFALGQIESLTQITAEGAALHSLELHDRDGLERLGRAAGLRVVQHRGIVLKPLPNSLMASLPENILAGFAAVADRVPDLCSMNYLVFGHA